MASRGQVNSYEVGLKHFQTGNYRDAIKAWRNVPPGREIAPKLAEAYFRYGLSFYNGGQVVQVLSELHQAINHNPEKAIYRFHLGLAYHRKGNLDKAISCYRKAVEADPKDNRFRYHLGLAFIEAGAVGQAAEHFLSIKGESDGDDAACELGLISAFLKDQQWDEALDLLKDVKEDNTTHHLQSLKGLALLMMGDRKQAKAALRKAVEAGVNNPMVEYYLGFAYAADGHLPSAAKVWGQALTDGLNPRLVEADLVTIYHLFAMQQVRKGALAKATSFWEKVLELRSQDEIARGNLVHAYFLMGNQYSKENRLRKAIRWWERVVALDPKNVGVLHNLALAHDQLGEPYVANRYWTQVINTWGKLQRSDEALRGSLWVAHKHIADNYLKMDKPGKAVNEYRKAMRYQPNDVETSIRLAQLYLEQDNPSAATRELERAQRYDLENTDLLGTLAVAYCEHRDCKKALVCWKDIMEIDRTNQAAAEQMTECVLHQAHEQWNRGQPDQAICQLKEATSLCPDRIPLYLLMGEIHLDVEEPDEAEKVFDQAIAAHPGKPDAHLGVGHTYLMHRMEQEAERHFQEAIACAPEDYSLLIAIGDSYSHANRFRTSKQYFQRAIDFDPKNPHVPLEIGTMLLKSGFADRSITYIKKALQFSPDMAEAYYFLGFAYFQNRNHSNASKVLNRARWLARRDNDKRLLGAIERLQLRINFARSPLGQWGLL